MATARKPPMTVGEYHTARQRLGFEKPPKPRLNQRLAKIPPKTSTPFVAKEPPSHFQRLGVLFAGEDKTAKPRVSKTPVRNRIVDAEIQRQQTGHAVFKQNIRGGKPAPKPAPKAPPKRAHAPTAEDRRIAASVQVAHELDAQRAQRGRAYIDSLALGSPESARHARRQYIEAENRYLVHLHRHSQAFGGLAGTDPLEGTYKGGHKNPHTDRSRGTEAGALIGHAEKYVPTAESKAAKARAHVPRDK